MDEAVVRPEPWNKGKLVGQKAPFKLKEIWAIRIRLQLAKRANGPNQSVIFVSPFALHTPRARSFPTILLGMIHAN